MATGISGDDVYYSWLSVDLCPGDTIEIECIEIDSMEICLAERVIEDFSKGYPDECLLQDYYKLREYLNKKEL